jgi:streptogrisin C
MKVKKIVGIALTAVVSAAAFATASVPAAAAPDFTPLNPEQVSALQRDLELTHDQALVRLAGEDRAAGLAQALRGQLGDSFGGAHYDAAAGKLHVSVTDPAKLDQVRGAGAEAGLARFSERQLNSAIERLDASESGAPAAVTGWGVDPANNRITITALQGTRDAAASYLAKSGVDPSSVTVVETAQAPRLHYDVQGGDAYYVSGQARCSIGFSVNGGFLSAGHCATAGSNLTGYNQVAMGSFTRYSFPSSDYSRADVNSSWTPRGVINNGTRVLGSSEAAVGSSICKSGSTTGWTCGTIQAKNQTVRYAEGTVYGLTQTNVYSDSGDSGGSLITGNQAQGMLSGGNTSTTYFQPVNPALSATGSTLVIG